MMHWFVWKNQNSLSDYGLWIGKLPKITRAPERYDTIDVPGRAGSLIMLEDDDVYDSYERETTIITRNTNPRLQDVLSWLKGSSALVFSNEIGMEYTARIVNEVSFERIGNDLLQAKVKFYCEPLKRAQKEQSFTFSESGTISNPGDVASRPIVSITASGDRTITIGGTSMTFSNISGTIDVDCDAGIVTKNGAIWTESVTGEFWKIPTGQSAVTLPASTSITIQPRWRWV